jgi:hypothetical protein
MNLFLIILFPPCHSSLITHHLSVIAAFLEYMGCEAGFKYQFDQAILKRDHLSPVTRHPSPVTCHFVYKGTWLAGDSSGNQDQGAAAAGFAQKVLKRIGPQRPGAIGCGLPPHGAECLWLSAEFPLKTFS